ncbi:MFS transporter [Massilia sp. Root351]|jgi:predicted MFS family arabinose efflux permease|uniref:MFS transporter n=1 Tax=Massilia sp. Root351 TaxID=1736522 RepID=UPI001E3C562C|nr:MFS transporter [Massilia sp. Root351]
MPSAPSARRKVPMLQPLRHRRYRQLWLANLLSNLGTWTQTFAAAWLVATISPAAQTSALVPAASYAPMLMFGLLAGVVADAVPRPKLLFAVNLFMALAAAGMASLAASGMASPAAVLALIFMMGTGSAFMWPAWQAAMSGLVQPEEVEAAASLNNLSFNLAATAGPALGGMLFVWMGAVPLFLFNAVSFGGLLLVYLDWIRGIAPGAGPEQAPAADGGISWRGFRAGLQAAFGSAAYRRLLRHTVCVFGAAIAYTALLPLFVRDVLRREAGAFGSLMACVGVGAVLAAFLLPELRARLARRQLLGGAVAMFGAMLLALPHVQSWPALMALSAAGGVAWSAMVTTLNGAAQSSFPSEVRARTLSVYLMAMALGQTGGSLLWGAVAGLAGVRHAMALAGAGLVLYALSLLAPLLLRRVQPWQCNL